MVIRDWYYFLGFEGEDFNFDVDLPYRVHFWQPGDGVGKHF